MATLDAMDENQLPEGVRSRFIDNVNGLRSHVLESGYEQQDRPLILLLHGFPELAYSWRKVIPLLSAAGYHVVAPDQRGYGRTTGADVRFDGDLNQFRPLNLVRDQMALLAALGRKSIALVVGHDFGSSVAAACATARPDIFKSLLMMSSPCAPLPDQTDAFQVPDNAPRVITSLSDPNLDKALATLDPPRKHYQWYYSTAQANNDMVNCEQGLHNFLRAYYHHKSADWKNNTPYPLTHWSAEQLQKLPTYYVMDLDKNMAETVAEHMPNDTEIAACQWLTDNELHFYSNEYQRTGFQGGLQSYRIITSGMFNDDLKLFAGRKIDVPTAFISGQNDWGIHQKPGSMTAMETQCSSRYLGTQLIDNAGHWVQQEKPKEVSERIVNFLNQLGQSDQANTL